MKRGRGVQTRDLEAFLPERWLTRDEKGREMFDGNALTRLAFGLGPRGCFGMSLHTIPSRFVSAQLFIATLFFVYS